MKKVRFASPKKLLSARMDDSECHSPRPLLERQVQTREPDLSDYRRVVYSEDPVHRFEYSDLTPYPLAKQTVLPTVNNTSPSWSPSSDLNLSMLDVHDPKPRPNIQFSFEPTHSKVLQENTTLHPKILSSVENTKIPPNVLVKDDNFFIKKGDLNKYTMDHNVLQQQFHRLNLDKENNPFARKADLARNLVQTVQINTNQEQTQQHQQQLPTKYIADCNCFHCIKALNTPHCLKHQQQTQHLPHTSRTVNPECVPHQCSCQAQIPACFHCEHQLQIKNTNRYSKCTSNEDPLKSAVDKKTWAVEKYDQSKKTDCLDVEKQTNVAKEKREPTIADLLRIIKLQNEQLQLLQEKVDKFITVNTNQVREQSAPVQNYMTEHVALQTIDTEHKISIGVMTSFEMVRTSTVINKELIQTKGNAQIQCNRSQISIKEVISKEPTENVNFLEGITPVSKDSQQIHTVDNDTQEPNDLKERNLTCAQILFDEKTLNEQSLYNVQVDNATTPMMSPEQSLYLDIKDYSDSDSTNSDDHSNVGWTYYNKVMTHVNGMLQDSDMPSSASALYRNTRQQCVQMQIDKTNFSVTKRVKFGDDPLGLHQPHIYAATTDTSLKMNQLAAKYLKTTPVARISKPTTTPIDMSFATRNYMERHKILNGQQFSKSPSPNDIPRFLDITALKNQPKLI